MKKLLTLHIFLFFCLCSAYTQTEQVRVTLKNGVAIVGELKEIDPTNYVILLIAGVETKVLSSEIESVEPIMVMDEATYTTSDPFDLLSSEMYGERIEIDDGDYPESFTITVGNQDMTMVLVRGGIFNMGYDDYGSVKMDSEPIHKVLLSSYYVSQDFITNVTACDILKRKYHGTLPDDYFRTDKWDEANAIATFVAQEQGAPYRLITEAEWEYAAVSPMADRVFEKLFLTKAYKHKHVIGEWCKDYWAEYKEDNQTDPLGPPIGKRHVARSFSPNRYVWNRNRKQTNTFPPPTYYVRIAISADQIINKIKDE